MSVVESKGSENCILSCNSRAVPLALSLLVHPIFYTYDLYIDPDPLVFGLSLRLDWIDWSRQLRWTEPIDPRDTDGPDRTGPILSVRFDSVSNRSVSVDLGRVQIGVVHTSFDVKATVAIGEAKLIF